jgi:hypothetical protein
MILKKQNFDMNNHTCVSRETACLILGRSKDWLETRMIANEFLNNAPINYDWFLVEDKDYFHINGQILFDLKSIERLKAEMVKMKAPDHCEY